MIMKTIMCVEEGTLIQHLKQFAVCYNVREATLSDYSVTAL